MKSAAPPFGNSRAGCFDCATNLPAERSCVKQLLSVAQVSRPPTHGTIVLLRLSTEMRHIPAMPAAVLAPRVTVRPAECDRCQGSGKVASDWETIAGITAVIALVRCGSCLGTGWVRRNVRGDTNGQPFD